MSANFYIMAMGRSGTTLLQNILDAHPNIVVAPESFFLLHLHTKYKDQKKWDKPTIRKFLDDLYTDRLFRLKWQIPKEAVFEGLLAGSPITSFQEACNKVQLCYRNSFQEKKITIIGDKNPIYSNFTEKLMEIRPSAKIIHMVRDPRGTASGQINTFKRKDALLVGNIWTRYNNNIKKLKEQLPSQYFLLKYEDLVANTEQTIVEVCKFLEVDFKPEMLAYQTQTKKEYAKYSEALKWKHKNLLKPIDKSIAQKWKISLTPKQIKHIEYTTHETAKDYGYKFSKPKKDGEMFFRLPFANLKQGIIWLILKTYFAFPFVIRKFILSIRSFLWDKKYMKK